MTDKQTAALKLGLEAIEACLSAGTEAEDQDASDKLCDARAAIREALAEQPNIAKYLEKDNSEQPAQEPVAYAVYHRMGGSKSLHWPEQHSEDGDHNEYQLVPLYAFPQPAQPSKPLTDEQIILIVADCASSHQHTDIHFARAIEAAHGIKGDA